MILVYVLLALLMLGILITVHEWGHFMAARLTKIPVREFAIGFGPLIKTWQSKKYETKFSIRAIPAGGYCAFYGENSPDDKEDEDPRTMDPFPVWRRLYGENSPDDKEDEDPSAMRRFPVWRRLVTVLMGPGMNFILAFVVAFGFYWATGIPRIDEYGPMRIVEVAPGSAAEQAGLLPGDLVLSVNGTDASGLSADGSTYRMIELTSAYQAGDEAMSLRIKRGEEELTLPITPVYSAETDRMMMGVTIEPVILAESVVHLTLPQAAGYAFDLCVREGKAIIEALYNTISTGANLDQMSGTVGVIKIVAETTRDYQLEGYLSLLVMISVNLGLVNLLPIPGLDGSQVILLLIEAVRRKPLPRKVESAITMVGFAALMMLFVVLTYHDISNIVMGR